MDIKKEIVRCGCNSYEAQTGCDADDRSKQTEYVPGAIVFKKISEREKEEDQANPGNPAPNR